MFPSRILVSLASLALVASTGAADVPSPPNSTVPPVLILVGRSAGVADPIGEYDVVVRDWANSPRSGVQVVLDFAASTDSRISIDQSPAAWTYCPSKVVIQNGDTVSDGIARFRVVGWCDHAQPATTGNMLRVFANGALIRQVTVAALDQNGDGVGASDLSLWLDDYFHASNAARSDLNGDGSVGSADLALWLAAFFAGGSIQGAGTSICPN